MRRASAKALSSGALFRVGAGVGENRRGECTTWSSPPGFHRNAIRIRVSLSICTKNAAGISIGITLTLVNLESTAVLTLPSLLIHKHDMSFHLLRSFNFFKAFVYLRETEYVSREEE